MGTVPPTAFTGPLPLRPGRRKASLRAHLPREASSYTLALLTARTCLRRGRHSSPIHSAWEAMSCSGTNPNTQPEWAMENSEGRSEGERPYSVSTEQPQPLPVFPSSLPAHASPLFPQIPSDLTLQRKASSPSESVNKPQDLPESCRQDRASENRPQTLLSELLGPQLLGFKHQGHHQTEPFKQAPAPPHMFMKGQPWASQSPFLIVIGHLWITDKGTGVRGGRKAAMGSGSRW